MKTFLLIFMISTHAGQQPTVQRIEQPSMAACQAQAKSTMDQLTFKLDCPANASCSPPYIVRTSCVSGS